MNKFIKYGWYLLVITPLVFAFIVFVNNDNQSNQFTCPDDFQNSDEETANFTNWVDDFFEKNPATSGFEAYQARINFYKENNCIKILKIIEEREILNKKSYELMDIEKYKEVISLNEEYIKENPYDLDPWVNETMAYYYLGDCINASASAYHVDINNYSFPEDNPDKLRNYADLFPYIINSDICKDK